MVLDSWCDRVRRQRTSREPRGSHHPTNCVSRRLCPDADSQHWDFAPPSARDRTTLTDDDGEADRFAAEWIPPDANRAHRTPHCNSGS
jgi:hypothetical protein